MKNHFNIAFLYFGILSVLASCADKSEITPLYEAKTLEQMKTNKLFISFNVGDIEVESPTEEFNNIPVVGNVLKNLADRLANLNFQEEVQNLEVAPQILSIPEVEKLDFSYISRVEVDSVMLEVVPMKETNQDIEFFDPWNLESEGASHHEINNKSAKPRTDISFVENLEIYLEPVGEIRGEGKQDLGSSQNQSVEDNARNIFPHSIAVDESEQVMAGRPDLVLSYVPDFNIRPSVESSKFFTEGYNCKGECLFLKIHKRELKNFLSQFSEYRIHIKTKIRKIPEVSLKVRGKINLVIEYDLGF